MRYIVFFSNPFGYGPSGKTISVAKYFYNKVKKDSKILICGSDMLLKIANANFEKIKINDRDEEAIFHKLKSLKGKIYVFSSQNRFAIKAAKRLDIPTAFLDGLAWFWEKIPDDHLLADVIFWINYPGIRKKIVDKFNDVIRVISGITPKINKDVSKREDIIFYIGGCRNPLTPLPTSYLSLTAKLLEYALELKIPLKIVTDELSKEFLKKFKYLAKNLKSYEHSLFVKKIANSYRFVTNGGQTAVMEAASVGANISFYLPINLSQHALIKMINKNSSKDNYLDWKAYAKVPPNLNSFSEKEAIQILETLSDKILKDDKQLQCLTDDFISLLTDKRPPLKPKMLESMGDSGAKEIFDILSEQWKL